MSSRYNNLVEAWIDITKKYPDRISLKDKKKSLTYLQLFQEAYKICFLLRKENIREGENIVCIASKNAESMVCFWGILLSGAIPVLLDQDDGEKINELKIREVEANIILLDTSKSVLNERLPSKILIDYLNIPADVPEPPPVSCAQSYPEICYILLTSGTTGRPKAVQVSHANVLHYTFALHERIGFPDFIIAGHVSTFSADLGFTNIMLALISGGMLRIFDKEEAADSTCFLDILESEQITLLKITSSHLTSLISEMNRPFSRALDHLIVGGERLTWEVVRLIRYSGICKCLYNHYGPTETTIGSFVFQVDSFQIEKTVSSSVPIGIPLGNTVCFLHDDSGEGVGELYIGGPGVSLGYYKNEIANHERFVVKEINGISRRYFKTGDICRQLIDGNFEFLYRTDRQVKIRGYRIEIGEIELAIAKHPDVENAYVHVAHKNNRPFLEAYVKLRMGCSLKIESLKNWLADELPGYKIPAKFFYYTKAPFNANGKVDINALHETANKKETLSSDNLIGNTWPYLVLKSWESVLGIDNVASTDDFFEIGGDSLLAIQLIGRLQRFGYKIHIWDINKHPVYEEFVALDPIRDQIDMNQKVQPLLEGFTLSQQLFLEQEKLNLDKYCQTVLLESETSVQPREMAFAIDNLLQTHKNFSRYFQASAKEQHGKSTTRQGLGVTVLDSKQSVVLQIQGVVKDLLNNISVRMGKLFVAHLFIDKKGRDFVFIACHHLLVDVVSWTIIIDELIEYYDLMMKNMPVKFSSENSYNQFYNLPGRNAYRVIKHNDNTPVHSIINNELQNYLNKGPARTRVITIVLPPSMTGRLRKFEDEREMVTLVGLMLCAFSEAISSEFLSDRLSIDIEFHGRPHGDGLPDLSRSIGWWSVTMPVHLEKDLLSPEYCSNSIFQVSLKANSINSPRERLISLPYKNADIRFNHLGYFPNVYENDSIKLKPSCFNTGSTRSSEALQEYPLNFTSRFISNALFIDIQYSERHFSRIQMKRLAEGLLENLYDYVGSTLIMNSFSRYYLSESNFPSVGQPLYRIQEMLSDVPNSGDQRNVLLTGVTGFLGIYLLRECLRNKDIAVYCIIRGDSIKEATDRLQNLFSFYYENEVINISGVHVLNGDLTLKNFGLPDVLYEELAQKIDLVFHAAADVNLVKKYSELYNINVEATLRIINFCQSSKSKELHYISTLAVSGCSTANNIVSFSEDDFDYGQTFNSDYEKTKFESEGKVRSFFASGGMGRIYRIGHIAADSVSGKFQTNIDKNRIFQIIKGILLMRQVPNVYQEEVAFSYVDIVSKGICMTALYKGITELQCLHVENTTTLPFNTIIRCLQKIGYTIESVDLDYFLQSAATFKGSPEEKNIVGLCQVWIQRNISFPRNVVYQNGHTIDVLASTGLFFPEFDFEWFSSMISDGVRAGFFPKLENLVSFLSTTQQQILLIQSMHKDSALYNVGGYAHISGNLDEGLFIKAIETVLRRADVIKVASVELRNIYAIENSTFNYEIEVKDFSKGDNPDNGSVLWMEENMSHPFNSSGIFLKTCLLNAGPENRYWYVKAHHLIFDGYSMSLLFNEVISLYSKLTTGLDDAALPSLNSFSDFVESEKKYLLSASFEQDRQFWLRQYRNQIESRAFYSCMKTGSSDVLTCRRAELTISRELFEKIDAFCRPLNCSILSYFISQILLLNKLYNNEDAVIGLPLFNRNGSTFKKTLGPFVNAIPFSADINFSDTFLQFLLQIKDRLNASFRHSAFPLINTLKELDVKGNIYNVIFSYQKNAFHRAINDSTIDIRYLPAVGQKEDLVFQLLEYSKTDDLRLVLSYKESLFSVEIIDRLLQHFFNLLESSFLKAELRLDQFTCLAPQEENYLIHGVNDTKREFPEDKTIATLFEEQSQRTPDNIALIFEAKELSYRHLNEEANRFADYLFKNYSLQRNSVILVSLERNEDLIISLLGVLKAECTYLSVDPEYPEERIHHICSESGAVVTITEKIMKEFFQQKLSYSSLNPVNHQQAEDNFCIIYTSGSTGMPKGCILSNRGVVNNMFSKIDLLKMKEGTTICHNAETYFVGSLWQLWTPLICGARVVLCNYEELRDLGKLFDKARFYGCGVLTVIPSQLQEYLNRADRAQMQTISTLILTGEKLDPQLIEKCHLLNPDLRIVNTYGQTESTDDITFYTIPVSHSAEVMPVGTATQNMSMYILSQDGALCPVGVLGEVYTSGVGIAKGYVKNYQLTREKFVPNPFRVGQIMYRTGDVGRWLENGFIEVVGRIDEQVKIRGYRVELAEIRKVLLCYRGIDEVVLLFKEKDSKGPIIIAYMICEEGIDVKAIRSFLLSKIPYYMLPGYYIRVNNFPLLPNGKVDKKKLFEGEGDLMSASADYVKPKNEVEQKLVDIWESVLKRSNIGVQDNFFDLGGHSLSAMTIINLVKSVFNVTVNIKEIFENPQISTLAEEVQKAIWVQQSESGPGVEHESREIIRL